VTEKLDSCKAAVYWRILNPTRTRQSNTCYANNDNSYMRIHGNSMVAPAWEWGIRDKQSSSLLQQSSNSLPTDTTSYVRTPGGERNIRVPNSVKNCSYFRNSL